MPHTSFSFVLHSLLYFTPLNSLNSKKRSSILYWVARMGDGSPSSLPRLNERVEKSTSPSWYARRCGWDGVMRRVKNKRLVMFYWRPDESRIVARVCSRAPLGFSVRICAMETPKRGNSMSEPVLRNTRSHVARGGLTWAKHLMDYRRGTNVIIVSFRAFTSASGDHKLDVDSISVEQRHGWWIAITPTPIFELFRHDSHNGGHNERTFD